MKRSEQVMEWQAEAKVEARTEDIIAVLRARFGPDLPEDLVQRIQNTADVSVLMNWLETAARARTLKKFRQVIDP